MSLRPLASLAVKMLGLYAILNGIPGVLAAFNPSITASALALGISPLRLALVYGSGGGLQILLGLALWWSSDGIARLAVREDGAVANNNTDGLTAAGFSLVGAYLLAEFSVDFSRYATNVYLVTQANSVFRAETMHIGAGDIVPVLVKGIMGVGLLLGARGVAGNVARLRDVGRERNAASSEAE